MTTEGPIWPEDTRPPNRDNSIVAKYFRKHARQVESAGNAVGSNYPELANMLWQAAAELRMYADRY